MAEVFVSIGTNQQRKDNVRAALRALQSRFGALRSSSVYETEAVGQCAAAGKPFYNLVVAFHTELSPLALKQVFRDIEASRGRTRERKIPCLLDLDLLLWDDLRLQSDELTLPRKDILQQAFVLEPMAELVPYRYYPGSIHNYAELWSAYQHAHRIRGAIARLDWEPLKGDADLPGWCYPDYTQTLAGLASA